ncbi:MAG: cyclodeaminase/cyclohydrolase family protein [Phycisphaerales bacterium]
MNTPPPTLLASQPFGALLEAVAAKTPAPGGGAVACAAGALACALAGMVVAYSLGKKDLAAHQPALEDAHAQLARARAVLLALADEDAAAYGLLNELQRLPEGDARRAGLGAAAQACVQVPLAALATCAQVLDVCRGLAGRSNKFLASDLEIAVLLGRAAAQACGVNVRVNLPTLEGDAAQNKAEGAASALLARALAA